MDSWERDSLALAPPSARLYRVSEDEACPGAWLVATVTLRADGTAALPGPNTSA